MDSTFQSYYSSNPNYSKFSKTPNLLCALDIQIDGRRQAEKLSVYED